jgi:hypothetical protein
MEVREADSCAEDGDPLQIDEAENSQHSDEEYHGKW